MDTEALKRSLLEKFVVGTRDRLEKIGLGVLDLEKESPEKAAEDVARELHTMKGEARMLGLSAIGQVAHSAEDVLKSRLDGKLPPPQATDLLLRACDEISDLLDNPDGAQNGTESSSKLVESMAQTSGHAVPPLHPNRPAPKAAAPVAAPKAPPSPTAAARPAPAGPPPAAPPSAELGRVKASAPSNAKSDDEHPVERERKSSQDRSIRVNVEILDSLGLIAGDLLVESSRARLRSVELAQILERFSRVGDHFLRYSERLGNRAPELDQLEGDLHLLRDDAFRFVRNHVDGLNSLHGNLAVLAGHVSEARLVPLSSVFEAFPRAVRDIARGQGKEVDLITPKTDVGVDRSMLADVRDALVHILRNAVDHGLEAREAREMLGKPPMGKLTIGVRVDGDMLHLEVEDDGRGMDPDRLRASAVSKRLMSQAQASALSDREAIDLIFVPGFSTREEVSELSGRGVGMDVVKKKVEALGGSVSVSSRVGRGTSVVLRLPQSLAMMRVLLVRLGEDVYGIPAADVEAVTRIKPEDRVEVFGTISIRHRDKPTALVALGPLMGLNGGPRYDRPPAVVVRHGSDRAALVVDGFLDEREVAVKPCGGEFLGGAAFIAGTAALEDGRIAVLLHVPDIMNEVRRIARPVSDAPSSKRLKVLLVDDSPIARATEGALVKALGHSVEECYDGEEAYARLQSHTYDLIMTDVQMPKMDGFQLTRKLKSNPSLSRTPVIILSSLASPEDKRRGLDAGADAYLVKGELGVEVLAQAFDRLT